MDDSDKPVKGTILIVTPCFKSVAVLGETLRGAGYRIEVISSHTTEFFATPSDTQIVLLIASYSEQRIGDVCLAIRRAMPTLSILVLGPDVEWMKLNLFAFGADSYMVTPFDQMELLARIKSLIRRSQRSLP